MFSREDGTFLLSFYISRAYNQNPNISFPMPLAWYDFF